MSSSTSKPSGSRWRGRTATGQLVNFAPVVGAFREIANWALDVAAGEVDEYPEEVERVENARAFILAGLAGKPLSAPEQDLLFTLGVLITAFDVHCGVPSAVQALDATLGDLLASPAARVAVRAGCPYAARANGHGYRPSAPQPRDQIAEAFARERARREMQK